MWKTARAEKASSVSSWNLCLRLALKTRVATVAMTGKVFPMFSDGHGRHVTEAELDHVLGLDFALLLDEVRELVFPGVELDGLHGLDGLLYDGDDVVARREEMRLLALRRIRRELLGRPEYKHTATSYHGPQTQVGGDDAGAADETDDAAG